MRTALQTAAALVVVTSSALAHADLDESQSSETVAATTHVRSPAMIAIGTSMIVVGAPSSGFAALMLALVSKNGGGGMAVGGVELYATGSLMTLVAGIALVAFGATQVKADTWQTGVWLSPGGLVGRF